MNDRPASGGSVQASASPMLILTQDADGAADWLARCRDAGVEALNWPAFRVHPLSGALVADCFRSVCDARPEAPVSGADVPDGHDAGLSSRIIVVLPSPVAVRVLADALDREGLHWPAGVWAGVPGRGTAGVFRQRFGDGVRLICPPPPMQDAAHLAQCLLDALREEGVPLPGLPAARPDAVRDGECGSAPQARGAMAEGGCGAPHAPRRGKEVLTQTEAGARSGATIVRLALFNRPDGRVEWLSALTGLGIRVSVHPVYQVKAVPTPPADMAGVLVSCQGAGRDLHWVVGASGPLRTVAGWIETLPEALRSWALQQPLWLPHPVLSAEASRLGFSRPSVFRDRQSLIERLQSADV